jgi:lysophospholipase L1-like esterase
MKRNCETSTLTTFLNPIRTRTLALIYWLLLVAASGSTSALSQVAILGDSLATGAGTHPDLRFSAKNLVDVFSQRMRLKTETTTKPKRLWPSTREFRGGVDWMAKNFIHGLSKVFLDTEEYSWGFVMARKAFPRLPLLIAAEDGARIRQGIRQLDRVLELTSGKPPEHVFVFFTGNDLCAPHRSLLTSSEDFAEQLSKILSYYTNLEDSGPKNIYVLGFLGVAQILVSKDILDKEIEAFGEATTCRKLREQGFTPKVPEVLPEDAQGLGMFLPPNPASYCPTLFPNYEDGSSQKDRDESTSQIANRVREYRAVSRQVVERWQEEQAETPHLGFHYVDGTESVIFAAEDIAQDCFHLSRAGQAKVAAAILDSLP